MLYLLAKMIMQGHGDIQGLTCHMVSGKGCTFSGLGGGSSYWPSG